MSKISKFLENELDRVNEYLIMADSTLLIFEELCENNCENISDNLDNNDIKVINFLNNEFPKIKLRISDAKEIISKFKNFSFEIYND